MTDGDKQIVATWTQRGVQRWLQLRVENGYLDVIYCRAQKMAS